VRADYLRIVARVAAPLKAAARAHPRLNVALWNAQYRLGIWDYLDDARASGSEVLALVDKHSPHGRILDLGCGTSENLRLVPGTYAHYHGVDVSTEAIARARRVGRPSATFEAADIVTYATSERYDAILLREVLYYLPRECVADLLVRLASMLAPGGRIFVQLTGQPDLRVTVETAGLEVVDVVVEAARSRRHTTVFLVLEDLERHRRRYQGAS